MVRQVTVDCSKEIQEQTVGHHIWTFQEFYDTHLRVSGEQASILCSRNKEISGGNRQSPLHPGGPGWLNIV